MHIHDGFVLYLYIYINMCIAMVESMNKAVFHGIEGQEYCKSCRNQEGSLRQLYFIVVYPLSST